MIVFIIISTLCVFLFFSIKTIRTLRSEKKLLQTEVQIYILKIERIRKDGKDLQEKLKAVDKLSRDDVVDELRKRGEYQD